jgi:hypothetical protein
VIAQREKIGRLIFGSVYPLYLQKILKKGRTESELLAVISWLSGYNEVEIKLRIQHPTTFESFFETAKIPITAQHIKGLICGIPVETITDPLVQQVRYLDKLVDELAKGKSLDKIIRKFAYPEMTNTPSKSYTCSKGHVFQKSSDCRTCPQCAQMSRKSFFLPTLSAPAQRALQQKGIHELQQVTEWSAKEILQWHGVGPSAILKINDALLAAGLSLKTTP